MPVNVLPRELLAKLAPPDLIGRLVTQDLTINRTVLNMLARSGLMTKKQLEQVALKVIKQYRSRYRDELKEGLSKKSALATTLNDKKLMIQRVQDAAVFEIKNEVKRVYKGAKYEWLPSDSEVPDPLHQLNYGKTFTVGKGEMPGDRYGCKCGMRILVDDNEIFLNDEL